MNIYAKKGDRVLYVGLDSDQIGYSGSDDPAGVLTVGSCYLVERTRVGSWCSTVSLQGFPGLFFNTVGFEDASPADDERSEAASVNPVFGL